MDKKINKKSQIEHIGLIAIISLIVLTSGAILTNNSTINSIIENIFTGNIIEKTAEIEILANTSLILEMINNNISALLILDNETVLPEQEIEFYLNENLISKEPTNLEGYALFSNFNISPRNYFLKAIFQGSSALYLNPSSIEKQVEIIELNGTKQIRLIEQNYSNITASEISNQTLLTVYTDKTVYIQNQTINIFGEILINGKKVDAEINLTIEFNETLIHFALVNTINGSYSYSLLAEFEKEGDYLIRVSANNLSAETTFYLITNESFLDLGNMICKEFEDGILWTSGYSQKSKGSTKYQTWIPETNCTEAGGQNCFLQDISVSSRTIYITPNDIEINGKSYIQISNPDELICNNPENGVYSKYLTYESVKGFEGQRKGWYCGEEKDKADFATSTPKCRIKLNNKFTSECYGIKAYSSQNIIIDVFKVKYKLCWDKSYGDNSNEEKR